MPKVIGVRFKPVGKIYFFSPQDFDIKEGDNVIVALSGGADSVALLHTLNSYKENYTGFLLLKAEREAMQLATERKNQSLYRQDLAIAALNSTTSRTLAAQAADELLNISGITASFVLYPDGDQVIISARSIGKANVQVILEPLGGGGNSATAGCTSMQEEHLRNIIARINPAKKPVYILMPKAEYARLRQSWRLP